MSGLYENVFFQKSFGHYKTRLSATNRGIIYGKIYGDLAISRVVDKPTFEWDSTKKVKYTDKSIGKIKIVDDFLPQPKDLVLKEETTKITISLTKSSIEFFKNEAEKYHTNYQTMIRKLIDKYASRYA